MTSPLNQRHSAYYTVNVPEMPTCFTPSAVSATPSRAHAGFLDGISQHAVRAAEPLTNAPSYGLFASCKNANRAGSDDTDDCCSGRVNDGCKPSACFESTSITTNCDNMMVKTCGMADTTACAGGVSKCSGFRSGVQTGTGATTNRISTVCATWAENNPLSASVVATNFCAANQTADECACINPSQSSLTINVGGADLTYAEYLQKVAATAGEANAKILDDHKYAWWPACSGSWGTGTGETYRWDSSSKHLMTKDIADSIRAGQSNTDTLCAVAINGYIVGQGDADDNVAAIQQNCTNNSWVDPSRPGQHDDPSADPGSDPGSDPDGKTNWTPYLQVGGLIVGLLILYRVLRPDPNAEMRAMMQQQMQMQMMKDMMGKK